MAKWNWRAVSIHSYALDLATVSHLGVHDLFSRQMLNEPYVFKVHCRPWNAQQH